MLGDEDAVAKAGELQSPIPGASESAEAAMEDTVISSEPIAAIEEADDDDDDLSFDLDDLDAETEDDDLDLGDEHEIDDDTEEETAGEEGCSGAEDDVEIDVELD